MRFFRFNQNNSKYVSKDFIRQIFSQRMSDMYRAEVPEYNKLVEVVNASNQDQKNLEFTNQERHGAIRLGKPGELMIMCGICSVMGMYPVGH